MCVIQMLIIWLGSKNTTRQTDELWWALSKRLEKKVIYLFITQEIRLTTYSYDYKK